MQIHPMEGWLGPVMLISLLAPANGLQCYLCGAGEPSNFCNASASSITCADDTQTCYTQVKNTNNRLNSQKNCIPKTQCQMLRNQNGQYCSEGVVTSQAPCTFCCVGDRCNKDLFNYGIERTTTTASPHPTARPGQPSFPGQIGQDLEACLRDYKKLINVVVQDPAQNFPTFCRELPFILLCVASSKSEDETQRKMAEQLANHMWALCPRDCDIPAGDNCTAKFLTAMSDIVVFGKGDQCTEVKREVELYVYCLDYNVGSCDGATAQRFALTLQAIKRESDTLCIGKLSQVTPTAPAEPADCNIKMASEKVVMLINNILQQIYGGHDVSEFCATRIPNTEQYLKGALATCSSASSTRVRSVFQFAKNLLGLSCDTVTPPPLCDVTEARKCIVDFWTKVDEAKDAQEYCSLIKPTKQCVQRLTSGCEEKQREELESLLQIFLNRIGDRCDDVIEPSVLCGSNITLIEGGPGHQLQFKMAKSARQLCKDQKNCAIYMDLVIQSVDGPKCPNGIDSKQVVCKQENGESCSKPITGGTWRDAITFHLVASVDNQVDGDVTVEVRVVIKKVINGVISERRTVCIITVYVIDQDKPIGDCHSSNDPHIRTFDQFYYNTFMQGLFLMYRNKQTSSEVQALFQHCGNSATCNCGVAIRSGDFVFVVEMCERKMSVCEEGDRHICNKHGQLRMLSYGDAKDPAMRIFKQGPDIEVILPHGTRISILYDQLHKLLNLVIHPSVYDWGTNKTEGLCGNFDGDATNDLTTATGEVYRPQGKYKEFPDYFSATWRLSKDQSIFSGVSGINFKTPRYCTCQALGDTNCDVIGLVEYCQLTLGQEVPLPRMTISPNEVIIEGSGRNKRSTGESILDSIVIDESKNGSTNLSVMMSREEASKFCHNHLNSKEEWSQWCLTLPYANNSLRIKPCIEDLMLTGDTQWADTALEGFKQDCITQLTKDTEYLESFEGKLMREKIMSLTCPGMCNKKGTCSDGKCICQAPYTGFDCSSSPQNTIPQFLSLFEDGLCDVSRGNCSDVVLSGNGFVDSPSLTCHFVAMQVTSIGVKNLGTKFEMKANFISDNQILCPTPSQVTPGGEVGWSIDVSNDAVNPSLSPVLLVSRDPKCATCRMDGANNTATCQRMTNTCIIENICYTEGQRLFWKRCLRCDPSSSTTQWTKIPYCDVNVASIVFLVLLSILILTTTGLCIHRHTNICRRKSQPPAEEKETTHIVPETKPVRLTTR